MLQISVTVLGCLHLLKRYFLAPSMRGCILTGRQIHLFKGKIKRNQLFSKEMLKTFPISDLFGINCATGMSALMRKELLDNKGGFEAFGCYLAEDFFFAKAVQVLT